jgi:ribulose-5-phosphate 4-epimerase/fuculose-1-phosphate aldolase
MATDMESARRECAIGNRLLAEFGLATGVTASLGHVSIRVPTDPTKFLVKGRGYAVDALPAMMPSDMVLCDLDGNFLDGPPGSSQCSEVKIHSCVYQARPDVMSVVHVHPRYTVLLSVLGITMSPVCREGMPLVRQPVPVYPDVALITTHQEGQAVASTLGNGRVALLYGHGAVAVGKSVDESVMTMLQLEEQARMNYLAYAIVGADHPRIPEDMIKREGTKPSMNSLPHFSNRREDFRAAGVGSGPWEYYSRKLGADM